MDQFDFLPDKFSSNFARLFASLRGSSDKSQATDIDKNFTLLLHFAAVEELVKSSRIATDFFPICQTDQQVYSLQVWKKEFWNTGSKLTLSGHKSLNLPQLEWKAVGLATLKLGRKPVCRDSVLYEL